MRKNFINKSLFFLALTFILCSCNRDPVFFNISEEVKLLDPQIKGVPTNFVIYDGRMYVASGNNLFVYKKGTDQMYWDKEAQPGGNILQIAATGSYLYALCSTDQNNNGKTVIKRFDKDNSSWHKTDGIIENLSKVHNIFAAGDKLFITATASTSTSNNISYTILYIDNSGTVNELITTDTDRNDTGELNGAAFDEESYFLSTKDRGVYKIDDMSEGALLIKYKDTDGNDVNVNFSGIINLQDEVNTILLIARNGDVYTVKDIITKVENVSMEGNFRATGALAIWKENDQPSCNRLLLAGRQDSLRYSDSGYTYGYLELELDINGIKSDKNFIEPGREPLSTVRQGENGHYKNTIGKYPVNYLLQVPSYIDSEMILFASTQKNGVWSYRDRNGIFQWNAE